MAIRGDNPDNMLDILKGKSDSIFQVEIAGVKTQIYPGSVYQERKNLVEFYLNAYDKIPSGKVKVKLFLDEPSKNNRLLDETIFPMPENFEEDKQIGEHRLQHTKASEIMTTHLAKLEPDDRINVALEVFSKNLFHALPVVEGGELAGIVTPFDVMKALLEEKPAHPEDVYEQA